MWPGTLPQAPLFYRQGNGDPRQKGACLRAHRVGLGVGMAILRPRLLLLRGALGVGEADREGYDQG